MEAVSVFGDSFQIPCAGKIMSDGGKSSPLKGAADLRVILLRNLFGAYRP